ncbi:questin oxidase family protein [Leptothoe spongobia]|uniref:Questin oxidase family protein n=1 Tax=Leptothoe spongobia TAU-MAC 1115 TaxID=1967444 RepID=A0A947GSH3_9CYAN|nr:questin oxidase family protein [Leptothoe spongobia]MBT9317951.1 questin oxidase family protein [Leptothoe spongobia TAU-MAC 1115]
MKVSETCYRLVEQGSRFHPLYGARLANHLPMVLIALDRIGVSPNRLEAFYDSYIPKLTLLLGDHNHYKPVDPTQYLGRSDLFLGFLQYFRGQVERAGTEKVLRSWVPVLLPGLAASAFHALIRLGYGIDAAIESEVCFALAYWAAEYQSLGDLGAQTDETMLEIAMRMFPITQHHSFLPGIIVDRLAEVSRLLALQNVNSQPRVISLEMIAHFSIEAFAQKDNFTLLHTVTACHAFRRVLPYVGDQVRGLRYLWQAILVAYLTTKVELEGERKRDVASSMTWSECFEQASLSSNDHVIKLTYTAWEEFQVYGFSPYRLVAGHQNNN